jgi:natural product precursor
LEVSIGDWMVQSFQCLNHNINKMKKLSLEMLRLSSDEVLKREQMAKIRGGDYWQCNCGHVGDSGYGSSPMLVMANDTQEALSTANVSCGTQGVTCEGLSN